MIDCRKEPLPIGQVNALAALMQKSEFQLLLRIIEDRANELIVEASVKALKAADHPNYLALAESSLKEAQRYQACLTVLDEIKNRPNPYLVKIA